MFEALFELGEHAYNVVAAYGAVSEQRDPCMPINEDCHHLASIMKPRTNRSRAARSICSRGSTTSPPRSRPTRCRAASAWPAVPFGTRLSSRGRLAFSMLIDVTHTAPSYARKLVTG